MSLFTRRPPATDELGETDLQLLRKKLARAEIDREIARVLSVSNAARVERRDARITELKERVEESASALAYYKRHCERVDRELADAQRQILALGGESPSGDGRKPLGDVDALRAECDQLHRNLEAMEQRVLDREADAIAREDRGAMVRLGGRR